MGYVHGDIKLENILVDEMGVCKIADFGMTRKIDEVDPIQYDQQERENPPPPGRHTKVGLTGHQSSMRLKPTDLSRHAIRHRNSTPVHGSPNPLRCTNRDRFLMRPLNYFSPHGGAPYVPQPAQDIWVLGVMLYCLLTDHPPFADSFEPQLQMKILHGALTMGPR